MVEYEALNFGLQMAIEMGILNMAATHSWSSLNYLRNMRLRKKTLFRIIACIIITGYDIVKLKDVPRSANKMANAPTSLVATLALGAKEDMTIPVCSRWVILLNDEDIEEEVKVICVLVIEEEDWC